MKISDVLTQIPLECRVSLNNKLEELTGYLYMTGNMLLQGIFNYYMIII